MNQDIKREYKRLRSKGWRAPEALRSAKTNVAFAELGRVHGGLKGAP